MNPRHALIVALLAGAWCLAPPVHATSNAAHGHDGTSQGNTQATNPANPSAIAPSPGYGENGDAGLPSPAATSHAHAANESSGNTGNCGNNASGIGSLFEGCSGHGSDPGSAGDNGESGMGWQSMLPGSIQ